SMCHFSLVPVTVRMPHVPGPGAFNDLLDRLIFRRPAEFTFDFVGAGNEACGVARTPCFFNNADGLPGDAFARSDDFAHARAAASTDIVERTLRHTEREHVRLSEIDDVDVIADARAVRRLIVGAVNLDVFLLAKRDLEDVGDEVRLNAMIFAETLGGAGGVEVTERDEFEAVNLVVPAQDFLEHQLRLAVRIDRPLRECRSEEY